MNLFHNLLPALLLFATLCSAPPAWAAADEVNAALDLYGEEPQVAVSHFPRPISTIAENISVITTDDIARLNAHTLAELLQTVPGFQLDIVRTPGSWSFFSITGSFSRHIQVLIDGVPQNFLSADNIAEIGLIPVQHIERIEIVKGAASAAWGSALGGVINVITRSPLQEKSISGAASASAGERHTTDLRGELSGTQERFGYYLSGGNLYSHGLLPGNRINFNHAFAKLAYDLPARGNLTFGLDIRDAAKGLEDYAPFDYRDTNAFRNASSYLSLRQPLADRLTLDMHGYCGRKQSHTTWGAMTIPDLFKDTTTREDNQGARIGLYWGDAAANLAAGVEYEHNDIRMADPLIPAAELNYQSRLDRYSAYLNGSYSLGLLTVIPGFRYDNYTRLEDPFSYNLGATLRLSDSSLFRIYGAHGYSLPVINDFVILNGRNELQNIETIQTGIESSAIPYLWLKGTFFYNNIRKIQEWNTSPDPDVSATAHLRKQVRQGFELEVKTSPIHGFALSGGYTYIDARNKDPKVKLTGIDGAPTDGLKLALYYDDAASGFRGTLTGNYVWWSLPDDNNPNYRSMLWDLHLTQKLFQKNDQLAPEIFFSVRNLFNGHQYTDQIYPNAPRWIEGGVRFRF